MTTIALLTWLIPIVINIYMDRFGAKRWYFQVNALRAMALIIHMALFFRPTGGNFYWEDIKTNTPILVFYLTSFWLFFELGLNIVQKRVQQLGLWRGLLYFDQKEGDSGLIDRFFKRFPKLHTPAKIITLILLILSIIQIYQNDIY